MVRFLRNAQSAVAGCPARVEEIGRLQAQLSDILGTHPVHSENLIALLQEIQQLQGYLSEEALRALAAASGISETEIYGVASFYTHFRFQPPAEHTIHVCQGTACHVRDGNQLLFDFEERLNIKAGQMTPDRKFGLERVACVGCCALAPVVLVDGKVRVGMKPKLVRGLLVQLGRDAVGRDAKGA